MTSKNSKLVMMRFDPRGGWVQPSEEEVIMDDAAGIAPAKAKPVEVKPAQDKPAQDKPANVSVSTSASVSTDVLSELGDSIVDTFNTLKLDDPRLQVWSQVKSTIGRIADKRDEQKLLEQRLQTVKLEIQGLRSLTSELVNFAYQSEVEIHATSKVRVQVAESLNQKIRKALEE
jgi:hypothetical protein